MNAAIAKLVELLIRFAVVPLFSKIIVEVVAYFQAKKSEAERNEKIDKAVTDYKEAVSDTEKEEAFLRLVRSR